LTYFSIDVTALKAGQYITVKAPLKLPGILKPGYQPNPQTDSTSIKEPICKLTWTMTPDTATAKKEKAHFTLVGTNDTTESIGIYYIDIRFTSSVSGPQLFKNDIINGNKSPVYTEPAALPSQPVVAVKPSSESGKPKKSGDKLGAMLSLLPGFGGKSGQQDKSGEANPTVDASGKAVNATPAVQPSGPITSPGEPGEPGWHVVDPPAMVDSTATTSSTAEATAATVATSSETSPTAKQEAPLVLPAEGKITQAISPTSKVELAPLATRYVNEFADGKRWWALTTRVDRTLPGFWVAPGESISYEWIMDVGAANTYDITIRENWKDGANLDTVPVPGFSIDKIVKVVVSPF
jgi:hypothetical protein